MFSSIAVGRQFGPYQIRGVLGKGASGTVYVGRRSDGVDVAVKVLSAFAMGNPEFRRAIPREFHALERLDHPGVVRAHRMGTIADVLFLELEWVDGPTVDSELKPGRPLSLDRALAIGTRAAAALHHCHERGVIHRDVKPSNLLLRAPDEPVLFDFGLAQDDEDPDAEPGRVYATPMTASPEQILAEGPVDRRADVYALGVTMYRLVSGQLPFVGERLDLLRHHVETPPPPLADVAPTLPTELADSIMRAIEKDPTARFASTAEFATALEGVELPADTRSRSRWRRRGA